MSISIRPATPEDAPAIAAIAESVRYQPSTADPSSGYLVYVGTPAEYAKRLSLSQTNYVAEHNGAVAAYLTTSFLPGQTATHAGHPEVAARLFGESALLVDQIGVRPESRGLGAAPLLYERAVADLKPTRMTASIMHHPLKNQRSVGFFAGRMGWKCIGEYAEGDGFLWGIYEWKSDGLQGDDRYPIGRFLYTGLVTEPDIAARIQRLRTLPAELTALVELLDADFLDAAPRPGAWTPRQLVHHVADSAAVFAERVRLILTEECPPIKTFDENSWADLADAKTGPVEDSLMLLSGVQRRLARLLESRPLIDFDRELFHPEQGIVKLDRIACYLDWHGRHHKAQIDQARGAGAP
jgi:ribosomal protein S18 acetylase RimI-like enzyme